MIKITVYDNYFKDTLITTYESNVTDCKPILDSLLQTSYDILITRKENIMEDI